MYAFMCFLINVIVAFATTCPPGYSRETNGTCTEDNECGSPSRCSNNSECYNTIGSFYCTCKSGFSSSSGQANFTEVTVTCDDINECRGKNAVDCGTNAGCNNIPGSYFCNCTTGYSSSSGNKTFMNKNESICKDIDECKEEQGKCGNFSVCHNTNGSYTCTCQQGFQSKSGKVNFTDVVTSGCEGFCAENSTTTEMDQELKEFIHNIAASCRSAGQSENEKLEDYEDLFTIPDKYLKKSGKGTNTKKTLSFFLGAMESTVMLLAHKLKKTMSRKMGSFEMSLEVINKQNFSNVISLNQEHADLSMQGTTVAGDEQADYAVAALITYENIAANMKPNDNEGTYEEENKRYTESLKTGIYEGEDYKLTDFELVSKVVTAAISNMNRHHLNDPVNITFKQLQNRTFKKTMVCAFLNTTSAQVFWSYIGCETVYEADKITCRCNHLSSFAILMAHYEIEDKVLDIITYIGLSISLICLAISILTFYFCRAIQGPRTTIHLHLCICLFMGYLIFLVGINKTENEVGCGVVAGLLHYFFLATFTWMCLEGVQLYLMVVEVFSSNSLKKRYMFAFGYGLPLVIVILSASINPSGYGTKKHCWLSLKNGFLWSFLAPVCVVILVNCVFFIITVWKLGEKFSSLNPELCKFKKIRVFTITAIAQLCILGCTWIFGIFQLEKSTIVMSYLFTIFNCFQGLFIFVLHCLLKKQVRDEYMRILASICNIKIKPKYSEFTSTTQSSTSQGLKSSQETGI